MLNVGATIAAFVLSLVTILATASKNIVIKHANCSFHGILLNNRCYCENGSSGEKCERKKCYPACSIHGACEIKDNVAKCVCDESFSGSTCSESVCPNNCFADKGQGICIDVPAKYNNNETTIKECYCAPKFTGRNCDAPRSKLLRPVAVENPPVITNETGSSSSNNTIANKTVLPLTPVDPSSPTPDDPSPTPDPKKPDLPGSKPGSKPNDSECPGDDGPCNGNGICDDLTKLCRCNIGWYGADCNVLPCPDNCFNDLDEPHGECIADKCRCKPDWEGDNCGTPTPVSLDLPCSQNCPADCENAAECDQYNLRYWTPVFHKESKTTDRVYSWVTPKTGHNHQWMLNEARSLGHKVPDDDQNTLVAARDCYMKCVRSCASKCFYALHQMTDFERDSVAKVQHLDKRLPGITGHQVHDEEAEAILKKTGRGYICF
jgi:hypothetical protein